MEHTGPLVVRLERLERLLADALDALLLLLLRVRVEREYILAQARNAILRRAIRSDKLPPVRTDVGELLGVLLFRAPLTVHALLLLRHARAAVCRLARPPKVLPVERQHRPVRGPLRHQCVHLPLLVEHAQALNSMRARSLPWACGPGCVRCASHQSCRRHCSPSPRA